MCIFLEKGHPKNADFIKAFLKSKTSFGEMAKHTIAYPRLHFYTPFENG